MGTGGGLVLAAAPTAVGIGDKGVQNSAPGPLEVRSPPAGATPTHRWISTWGPAKRRYSGRPVPHGPRFEFPCAHQLEVGERSARRRTAGKGPRTGAEADGRRHPRNGEEGARDSGLRGATCENLRRSSNLSQPRCDPGRDLVVGPPTCPTKMPGRWDIRHSGGVSTSRPSDLPVGRSAEFPSA